MINSQHKISQRQQCDLLSVCRSSLYYKPVGETQQHLELMRLMDEIHLKHPTFGVLRLQDESEERGHRVHVKRMRRLRNLMVIMTIYPKRKLSKLRQEKYIQTYLL